MKNTPVILTLSLLLSACAAVPVPSPDAQSGQTGNLASAAQTQPALTASQLRKTRQLVSTQNETEPPLPVLDLTEELLFKLLTVEIAAQRGEWKTAYVTSLSLAQQTRDPRLAQRAMEIALAARQHGEALSAIRVWRSLAPGSEQATQYFLGFLMLTDNINEAKPIFEQRLRDTAPASRGTLMFQIQRLLSRTKDKAAGFALLEQILAPYRSLPEAHLALAQGAFANGDTARAQREALLAQAAKPDSELAVLTLAQVTPDKAEAAQALQRYLATYPKAREARLAFARLLVEQKQYAQARNHFELLLKDNPQDLTTLYALGLLSAQAEDSQAAEKYLTAYLNLLAAQSDEERDPTQALLLLSQIAEERKDTEAALKWLAQIDPGEAYLGAQIKRAQLLAKRGDLIQARRILMELTPDTEREQVQVMVAEAHILRDADRLQEALAIFESGIKRFPTNTDLLYDYAMLAEKANKLDLMEKHLRKIMSIAPKNQHAYNALGYTLAERNIRLPEALKLINKALELAPEDPFIMDSLGWVYYRMGRLKEAEDTLRRAYALRPDPEIAAHLGEVLWVKGQKEDAQKFWREAKTKDPHNDTLKSTLIRLQVQL